MKRFLPGFLLLLFVSACSSNDIRQEQKGNDFGVSGTEIHLGSSLPLSGHAGFLGTQYLYGALAYLQEVNETGGVAGRQIKVHAIDDQYNPVKTIANSQKLLHEQKVFAIFNYVGTPTSVAVKPIIDEAQIPAYGFFTGAEALRNPVSHYLFHLRDSYFSEAEGAVRYLVDKLRFKKIAVFYQEDEFGIAVLSAIQIALQKRGLETVATDTYIRGSQDIDDSLEWINMADIDAVIMVGTYTPLAKFVRRTHELGHFPVFVTVSFVGAEAFARELIENQHVDSEQFKDILVTQVVPSPFSSIFPGTTEYLKLFRKYYPMEEPNYVAFEGFLNARVIAYALEKVGRNLDRSSFIEALENIDNFDLGIEKTISYGPDDRQGIDGIYYSRLGKSGRFEIFEPDGD